MLEDDEYFCEECGFAASTEEPHHCHQYEPSGSQSSIEHHWQYGYEYNGDMFHNRQPSKYLKTD
jgi:hypothetical protein|tara:strand:- start:3126 stop:3317 length:192 start_codon:yes stop_codon:yes gene_type:complete